MGPLDLYDLIRAIVVIVCGATGTWALLPHSHGHMKTRMSYVIGGLNTAISLLTFATLWRMPGSFPSTLFFYLFGLVALGAGVMTITSRNPVYSALWFAAVVLSSSGLFLLAGAQFLAAGTIIVYAGAIIVTFLFVLMLAQREGRATYDRMARSPARATFTCFLLFWSLLYALLLVRTPETNSTGLKSNYDDLVLTPGSAMTKTRSIQPRRPAYTVLHKSLTQTNQLPEVRPGPTLGKHVAGLGGTLYTDHLVTVELAGALLFVALIGALAIATPKPPFRPGQLSPPPPAS